MEHPWYKQFWPWFLITLPSCAVIGSFVTLSIFSSNSVSLVAEDYYKKGKAINIDLTRVKAAKSLDLKAVVKSDGKDFRITLDKGQLEHFVALNVTFTHRTLADKDFKLLLTADAKGVYRHTLDKSLSGPWFIELEPYSKEWLIQGKVTFPSSEPVPL
ncbi:FixH family protein [Vibrio sp. JC009]|uniref:FixH family protein n=1 Tax=Vibrio sp. JC009 TaxID=2912314 RepID=UPI0023AFE65F|nr:FixH family protein [Vibrio sp. JC009]WED23190.1 FixH family protein [Vibrio sp. JC009]